MYAKDGFIRKSHAMHELSSNNPDLARQVFCILLGDGTSSCRRLATWVVLFFCENRMQGSHLSPLEQVAIHGGCTHRGDSCPCSQACSCPEVNVSQLAPLWIRGEPWGFSPALEPPWLAPQAAAESHQPLISVSRSSLCPRVSWFEAKQNRFCVQ